MSKQPAAKIANSPQAHQARRQAIGKGETVRFCAEWDQNCFDPAYPTEPLPTSSRSYARSSPGRPRTCLP